MVHVLVVDDEPVVREVIVEMVADAGHTVLSAEDGNEALRLFREHSIDLVITDLIMPAREGLETILELKRLDPDVRIIAMSGGGRGAFGDYLEMALHLGAHCALAKPLTRQALQDAVDGVLAGT
jgi:CheY-like chemotaxis protein